ncbi:MAG: hypothetical protein AA908_10950 [Chlorobi bacterium NICIL-2]|nr:MAG: hypothetical protein AA908_10950 [Chlorobi bacterium NICIL-2]
MIAHHYRALKINIRKITAGLQSHTYIRFPAGAFIFQVRAVINPVNAPAMVSDFLTHPTMQLLQLLCAYQPFSHTTLIGNHKDMSENALQQPKSIQRTRFKIKFFPA